jgi:hypothetical protein
VEQLVEVPQGLGAVALQDRPAGAAQPRAPQVLGVVGDRAQRLVVDRWGASTLVGGLDRPQTVACGLELVEDAQALSGEISQVVVEGGESGEGVVALDLDAEADGGGEACSSPVGAESGSSRREAGTVLVHRHGTPHAGVGLSVWRTRGVEAGQLW